MLIRRCAWHRQFYGYTLVHGVASWRGRSFAFSDGVCRRCAVRVRAEWQVGRPVSLPTPLIRRLAPLAVGRVAIGVGFAALLATVLPARLISDARLEDPAGTPVAAMIEVTDASAPPIAQIDARTLTPPETPPGPRPPVVVRRATAKAPAMRHAVPTPWFPTTVVAADSGRALLDERARIEAARPAPAVQVAGIPAPRPGLSARTVAAIEEEFARSVVRHASTRLLLTPPEEKPRHAGLVVQAP